MTFGALMRKHRLKNQLLQYHVARKLNVSPSLVSLWECDRHTPNLYVALEIANLLGFSLDELWDS